MYACMVMGVMVMVCCGERRAKPDTSTLPQHLREIMEDSGLDGYTRYWIGEYLYTDYASTLHTTMNCEKYREFPGQGHRRVICTDTAEITRLHAEYFCEVCLGDSLREEVVRMIKRNEREIQESR